LHIELRKNQKSIPDPNCTTELLHRTVVNCEQSAGHFSVGYNYNL